MTDRVAAVKSRTLSNSASMFDVHSNATPVDSIRGLVNLGASQELVEALASAVEEQIARGADHPAPVAAVPAKP